MYRVAYVVVLVVLVLWLGLFGWGVGWWG
jgi:hypothetical protein